MNADSGSLSLIHNSTNNSEGEQQNFSIENGTNKRYNLESGVSRAPNGLIRVL